MTKIEQKISQFITQHTLLREGQRVLIALSGGADSVCLLRVLQSLGYECHAAHCNFHLRGEESNRDEQFVEQLCKELSVPLYLTHFDTVSYAQQNGVSIEMAARDLRYAYFKEVLADKDIDTLAVGHHQDDQIETVLLNMTRGTGIRGVAGIMPRRTMDGYVVVRPLLSISHDEVKTCLQSIGQSWVEDSTNQHDDVGRNVVRLNVVPELERVNKAVKGNLLTTIANLQEVERVYRHAIERDIAECEEASGVLSIPRLLATVSPQSVLHEWLAYRGFNATQQFDILAAARLGQSGKMFMSDGAERLLIDRTTIVLESSQTYIAPEDVRISIRPAHEVTIQRDAHHAYLDADKVRGELTIRLVQPSDSFHPFGMKGRKLLSDFLTDCKQNLFQKQHQLLVCDECDIAWVVGLRASEKYRVDTHTQLIIELTIQVDC